MKKFIVPSLWISALLIFFVSMITAQSKPFSARSSGILFFITASFILTAMLIQTIQNKKKNLPYMFLYKIIFVAAGFSYNLYQLIVKLLNT